MPVQLPLIDILVKESKLLHLKQQLFKIIQDVLQFPPITFGIRQRGKATEDSIEDHPSFSPKKRRSNSFI